MIRSNIWVLTLCACIFLASCSGGSGGLEGTYADKDGWLSIEFKLNGTAISDSLGGKSEVRYELRGNEIVFELGDGSNQIYTLNDDGSIDAGIVVLRKQSQ